MSGGTLFAFVQRHATSFMAVCLVVGILLPGLARTLNPLVMPFAVVVMTLSLVRIDWAELTGRLRRPWLAIACGLFAMIVPPLAVWAVQSALVDAPGPLATGVGIMSAMPPLMAGAAYAVLLGLDAAFVLVASLAGSLAAPLVTPLVVHHLLDVRLDIDTTTLMTRLAVMLGIAFAGALVIRRVAGRERLESHTAVTDSAMMFFMCTLGIGAMDGVGALLAEAPGTALLHIGTAFAMAVGFQLLALALAWRAGPRRALDVALVWGFRNGFLALAAIGDSAGPEVRLFIVVYQFPLYIMPALMRAPVRFLARAGPGG